MSNKLTETNNWGVKFFFPCIHQFTKYHPFMQDFVYLSCATSTSHWQNGGLTAKLNISAFFAAECVSHSAFICKLASVKTHRLRSV